MNQRIILILACCLVLLGLSLFYISNGQSTYLEHNGVKISYEDYNTLNRLHDGQESFDVCNTDTGNCIRFTSVEEIKKVIANG